MSLEPPYFAWLNRIDDHECAAIILSVAKLPIGPRPIHGTAQYGALVDDLRDGREFRASRVRTIGHEVEILNTQMTTPLSLPIQMMVYGRSGPRTLS